MAAPPTKSSIAGYVNMMPLIDILFQLIIFFLVATQIATAERSLPIVLPQASAAKPLTSKPKEFFIDIDHDGHYFAAACRRLSNRSSSNWPRRRSTIRSGSRS